MAKKIPVSRSIELFIRMPQNCPLDFIAARSRGIFMKIGKFGWYRRRRRHRLAKLDFSENGDHNLEKKRRLPISERR